jgi:hypothetical protein
MMAHYQRQDRSEDVDKLCCMYAHHDPQAPPHMHTAPHAQTNTCLTKPEPTTHRIARAVSRLEMISEPGVESLLRLTAARIAAYEHHHHQSNGALLERLPQELKDLIGECRASRQQNQNGTRSLEDRGAGLFSLFLSFFGGRRSGRLLGAQHDLQAARTPTAVACSESGGCLSTGARVQLAAPVRRVVQLFIVIILYAP